MSDSTCRSRLLKGVAAGLLALAGAGMQGCGSSSDTNTGASTGGVMECTSLPPLAKKATYTVGFAQIGLEDGNPWRIEETRSMKAEAAARGYTLVYSEEDSSGVQSQVANVNALIQQKVDAIFLSPNDESILAPVVVAARKACIPLFLVDRDVDHTIAVPGSDYVSFLGSDFDLQGKLVAQWLAKNVPTGGAKIIELEGTTGATPAILRKKGFDETAMASGMTILASQTASFEKAQGQTVATTLMAANPTANVIYAHNDEMGLGAIAAAEAAGKVPGKDMLFLSIDGEKAALQAIIDGKLSVSVTSSPSFGPLAFDTMEKYANGDTIPTWVVVTDTTYDKTNAQSGLGSAF